MDESQVTATLENWSIIDVGKFKVARGRIIGDTKKRFADGSLVVTSVIVAESLNGDMIKTRYSLYRLGKKAEADE